MRTVLMLTTFVVTVLAPGLSQAQHQVGLIGIWEIHTNATKAGFEQYYVLNATGTYIGVYEDPKSKGRETGDWEYRNGRVYLRSTVVNGRRQKLVHEFIYHPDVEVLQSAVAPAISFCKESHPHPDRGRRVTLVSDTKAMRIAAAPASKSLLKIQQEGYSFYDKKTKLSYSIQYNEHTGEYAVESEKKDKTAAMASAKKVLQGVSATKIYWVQACGL